MQNKNAVQGALAIALGNIMIRHEVDGETALRAYTFEAIDIMMYEGVSGDDARGEVTQAKQRCTQGNSPVLW